MGECGLDGFYLKDEASDRAQEYVLERLIEVAQKHDLPVILHTRKREARTFEILQGHGVQKAVFHCYSGKVRVSTEVAVLYARPRLTLIPAR